MKHKKRKALAAFVFSIPWQILFSWIVYAHGWKDAICTVAFCAAIISVCGGSIVLAFKILDGDFEKSSPDK